MQYGLTSTRAKNHHRERMEGSGGGEGERDVYNINIRCCGKE
jgi:hypothetical protein